MLLPLLLVLQGQQPFPHEAHANLFPLCQGCHRVGSGDPAELYPAPDLCASCHDGEQADPVRWSPPTGAPDYRHPSHEEASGVRLACEDCHGGGGDVSLTDVSASCGECHTDHHEAGARCRVCHGPETVDDHGRAAHAGCGGSGCHEAAWVEGLRFDRELCLVCHQDLADHRPGKPCGTCHAVGQPEPVGSRR